jgi:hypothetical protein
MYFHQATSVISEIGGHGDCGLSGDAFNRDDRSKRIENAADSLCDLVFEYLRNDCDDLRLFKQEHLPTIARMIAIGMMAQFEHDLEAETAAAVIAAEA